MRRALIIGVVLLFASVAHAQETVTINLGANNGAPTYRASGFLHGLNSTQPNSTTYVAPLKPKELRGDYNIFDQDANTYATAISLGAKPMYILGDAWIDNYARASDAGALVLTSSMIPYWIGLV